jgi:hypothetical protein
MTNGRTNGSKIGTEQLEWKKSLQQDEPLPWPRRGAGPQRSLNLVRLRARLA